VNLSLTEIQLFYKLWYALVWNVNEKHKIVSAFKKPVYGERTNEEPFIAVRAKLWENPQWIDDFLRENEFGELTEIEHGILKSWRNNFIKAQFIVMKHLKLYSVFMSFDEPAKLYGVCGISNSIKATAPYEVPYMVDAVLLPFKDKIIYDSFIGAYPVSFGTGIRNSMKDMYEEIKEKVGIIETMGMTPVPVKPAEKKMPPAAKKPVPPIVDTGGVNIPKTMSAKYMEIAEIIEKFCDEKLNDEYKNICLKALAKLCRKRPSPVESGRANTWACGIVYAIGSSNFIFDRSQPINMTAGDIAKWFGISKNTAGGKAAEIKNLLNLSYFNTEFSLKSLIDKNPMIWYLKVNGYLVDIRTMPRGAQEEAFRKGLIPYIPADEKK